MREESNNSQNKNKPPTEKTSLTRRRRKAPQVLRCPLSFASLCTWKITAHCQKRAMLRGPRFISHVNNHYLLCRISFAAISLTTIHKRANIVHGPHIVVVIFTACPCEMINGFSYYALNSEGLQRNGCEKPNTTIAMTLTSSASIHLMRSAIHYFYVGSS